MALRGNRILSLHILEILNKYSDSKNKMSQTELMRRLEDEHEEKISRRTCSQYLKELRECGYISGTKGIYRNNLFTEREIRTLIDGVMFGKLIPEKEAITLVKKLKSLSENSMRNKVKNITYLTALNRTKNKNLYSILDSIDEAIEKELKIKITQFSLKNEGELVDHNSKIVDPYFVVADQSRYYLLCNANRNNQLYLEPRRIDRFSEVEIIDETRTPLEKVVGNNFDIGKYMKEHIYMFSGEVGPVEIKIDNDSINSFVDWYGCDYYVIANNDNQSVIRINTNYDAVYYWMLQYGEKAEVLCPIELRNKIKQGLIKILQKYSLDND